MRALHLPAVAKGSQSPFHFPDKPAAPSNLSYTATGYPEPRVSSFSSSHGSQHTYLVRVKCTALTRGELTWQEILEPSRFYPHGGAIPGHDLVGTIEKTFPSTSTTTSTPKFSLGDHVWGLLDFDRDGAASTYTLALESELSLVPRPTEPTIPQEQWEQQLATLPLSGLTAYQALFTHGKLLPNPSSPPIRVLVTGAAGSVGIPTIQLAKATGLHVTAVCSAANHALVTSLLDPSDEIIDYTATHFSSITSSFHSQNLSPVDLVVDCAGGSTLSAILLDPTPVVKRGGKIITIVAPITVYGADISSKMSSSCATAHVDVEFFIVKPNADELDLIATRFVVPGKLKGHVDAVFPLDRGREAMELVESRGRRGGGKVVLRVET